MVASSPKPKIVPLTSARFFAAFAVVLHHSFPAIATQNAWLLWLKKLVVMGYVSVSFFYMLSGFILAVVYLKADRPVNKQRFFLARFARIYPLYAVAMLLDTPHFVHIMAMAHRTPLRTVVEFVATAGLIQAWFNITALNPPGWSLSTEAFFYLVFPFLGIALWKLRRHLVWPVFLALYGAGLFVVGAINSFYGRDVQSFNPAPYLFIFLMGILLAKIFVSIGRDPKQSQRLEEWAPWMLVACLLLLLLIPLTRIADHESMLQHGLLAPIFAVAILAFASGNQLINKIFAAPWLVVLGEASYALYLIHYPIHSLLRKPLESIGMPVFLLYLLGTIGLSVASYYFLEIPARRWILARVHVRSLETEVTSALSQ